MARLNKLLNKKRPQLRRCAFCDKPGHNKSTCPVFLSTIPVIDNHVASPIAPIRFFVHHVSHAPTSSPHIINLKKDVSSASPDLPMIAPQKSTQHQFNTAYQKIKLANDFYPTIEIKKPAINFDLNQKINKKVSPADIDQNIFAKLSKTPRKEPSFHDKILEKKSEPKQKKENLKKFTNYIGEISREASYEFSRLQNSLRQFLIENFVFRKMVTAIILLVVILILPGQASSYYQDILITKNKIAQDSTAGFLSLQNSTAALMQADLPVAQLAITEALNNFGSAVQTMQTKHQIIQKIATAIPILEEDVKSRQDLLLAGQKIALGNTYLLKGIGESQENPSSTLGIRMDTIVSHLNSAIPNYKEAMVRLNNVDADTLPIAYQGPFKEFRVLFGSVLVDLEHLSNLGVAFKEIFGASGQRRYLLAFQNSDELRPTGGFIGSIAILDIKDGKILSLNVPAGGSYDLEGQLDQYLQPPSPLLLMNNRWEFQDSNWFPDFAVSAQKMMWFYRHSRNVTVDGVIAVNSSVLQRLLAITGPISDTTRDVTLTSDNALTSIQAIVEDGPEKQLNKPKQILSDLAPQFIDHFKNSQPKDLLPLLVSMQEALSKKEIQAYFTDEITQKEIEKMGWSGKILKTNSSQDYLTVINTNIGSQKSDARIKQTISHEAVVGNDGTITDTVIITRSNTGTLEEKFYGANNIDYIRIYVPKNSKLISASGFSWPDESKFKASETFYKYDEFLQHQEKEISVHDKTGTRITEEFEKTTFGNWVITAPGQTSQVQFTYKLPFKIANSAPENTNAWNKIIEPKISAHYQLIVQKQSGIESNFESQIIFPTNWEANYIDGNGMQLAKNGASIAPLILDTDRVWGLIVNKSK